MEKEAQFMQNCTLELNQLKLQLLNVQISEQAFRENDDKTKFYFIDTEIYTRKNARVKLVR